MTLNSKRLPFQIAFALLIGFGALAAGIVNFYLASGVLTSYAGLDISNLPNDLRIAFDVQERLLAGLWISAGIFAFAIIRKFEENTNVIRLILLGMALGSVGELITKILLHGDVQDALIKCTAQTCIYLGMELWRGHLTRKPA